MLVLFCRSGKPQTGFSLHQPIGSDVRYHNGDHPSHHPTPSVGLSSLNAYGSQHAHQPQTITHSSASGFELHGDVAPTPPPRRAPSSVNASPQHRTTPTIHRCFFALTTDMPMIQPCDLLILCLLDSIIIQSFLSNISKYGLTVFLG